MYQDHRPQGDPCAKCMKPEGAHRVKHEPRGEPCTLCGLPSDQHRKSKSNSEERYYVGIDGEGQGRQDHRYVMLAWSSEDGTKRDAIEAKPDGRLSTIECLEFILSIPNNARIFGYAFNYDLTKILCDVDDETLYKLMRPELRQRSPKFQKLGPKPVKWGGYLLNKIATKFVVSKGKRRRVIWDVFQFFQSKFTSALTDWKVGENSVIERMILMKDKRSEFDTLTREQILEYCYQECAYMATLASKLVKAHENADLKLRSYFGAGSTASAILKRLGVKEMNRETPKKMEHAVASAFFGGRFENSVIGEIKGPVWGYDISSAYPYQTAFLPCLDCGKWEKTRSRKAIESARHACVRYSLDETGDLHWGPFPFRLGNGSIAFPSKSGGGWVWRDEYLAGERLFTSVRFKEAFVYHTDCHHQPFASVPAYYLERLRIGKEGPGIVIKLGMNSLYGKLAQSLGAKPPFQCWIWAGMITSGTRGQILEMLGLHKDRKNMLMVATDGVYSHEKIEAPTPMDTNTYTEHRKPLGGWESKCVESNMFAARPGIYFPVSLAGTTVKEIRARGVGRAVVLAQSERIVEAHRQGKARIEIANVTRFHGAKSSISRSGKPGRYTYQRSPNYGQWRTRPLEMTFDPMPKRERARSDGSLILRSFPKSLESMPYKRSLISVDALLLKMATLEADEQPDGHDLTEYEE